MTRLTSQGTGPVSLARDTSPAASRRQVEMWRAMSPCDKATLVADLSLGVQQLALAGIRRRHPGVSDREAMLRLAIVKLGRELARQAYPDVAALLDTRA